MYETINSPVDYGGLTLKNRIIFAPTSMGLPGDELIARLRAIAKGGCAMIILGDVPVGQHGFGLSLYSKKGFAFYQRIAETVHAEGRGRKHGDYHIQHQVLSGIFAPHMGR